MDFWLFWICFLFYININFEFDKFCFIKDYLCKHIWITGWCLVRQRNIQRLGPMDLKIYTQKKTRYFWQLTKSIDFRQNDLCDFFHWTSSSGKFLYSRIKDDWPFAARMNSWWSSWSSWRPTWRRQAGNLSLKAGILTSVGDPWHFVADPDPDSDPYLWLMDPDPVPDPDPTPDPAPSFIDFKNAKKKISHFFLITCHQVHHLQSKKFNFLLKFCVKMLFCRHSLSPLNTCVRKGTDPDPHLWQMVPDPDPGGPKTCGSCGSGYTTLILTSILGNGQTCGSGSRPAWIRIILSDPNPTSNVPVRYIIYILRYRYVMTVLLSNYIVITIFLSNFYPLE